MTNTGYEMSNSVSDIQNALYQRLPGGPLTASVLAQALQEYFPDADAAELERDCEKMLIGIRSGAADCEKVHQLKEEDVDQEIKERLWHVLGKLSPIEEKQYLIQLYEIFYRKSGKEVTPELAAYIAGMKTPDLFNEVIFLIHQEGKIAGVKMIEAMEAGERTEEGKPSIIAARAGDFTDEEHMWIAAAGMYAAGSQADNPVTDPETIGRQVGFLGRFVQIVGHICKDYVAPALVGVACVAGSMMICDHAVDWMIAGEEALASLAFFGAESIVPPAIAATVGALGMSIFTGVLLMGTAISLMYIVSNAMDDLDRRSEKNIEKADVGAYEISSSKGNRAALYDTPAARHEPDHGVDSAGNDAYVPVT